MFDPRFFRTKLGKAAIISIAAMLAFNMVAFGQQLRAQPVPFALSPQSVELA